MSSGVAVIFVASGNWLNYHRENDELLRSCEVEELEESLTRLLNNELSKVTFGVYG